MAASLIGASLSTLVSYVFAEIIFDQFGAFSLGLIPVVIILSVLTITVVSLDPC